MHSNADGDDLFLITHTEKHDARYFAMLNNAVAVSNTRFDGGKPSETLAYYKFLLNIDIPNCPLKFNLSEKQLEALTNGLNSLFITNEIIESCPAISPEDYHKTVNMVIAEIKKSCDLFGICYLPSGWVNYYSGHFAGLKVSVRGSTSPLQIS